MPASKIAIMLSLQATLIFSIMSFRSLCFWVQTFYGKITIEAIFYNLMFGMDAASGADKKSLGHLRRSCFIRPLRIAVMSAAILAMLYQLPPPLSGIFHIGWAISLSLASILLFLICRVLFIKMDALGYVITKFKPTHNVIDSFYINPNAVAIQPVAPKNLVLIFIESLEAEYRNPILFGKNLLASLDSLGGQSISYFQQFPGAIPTTCSAVATQLGIPFIVNRMAARIYNPLFSAQKSQRRFFPNAIGLGDILASHGYYNLHLSGALKNFQGLGPLYHNHGFTSLGLEDLTPNFACGPRSNWGLYDEYLLDIAAQKLRKLKQATQPFSLVLNLVDTHGPAGDFSPRMQSIYGFGKNYTDLVEYTANIVAQFITNADAAGLLENTCVAILGDHLSEHVPLSHRLDANPARGIYNRFICKTALPKLRGQINHFDIFPTLLELMGFTIAGGKLGLGISALQPNPGLTTLNLQGHSETYNRLWTT